MANSNRALTLAEIIALHPVYQLLNQNLIAEGFSPNFATVLPLMGMAAIEVNSGQ